MKKIKILLICAGGASTGLLMQKMEKYAKEIDVDLDIKATGVMSYDKYEQAYDVILIGPQIRYKLKEIEANVHIPCAVIESLDYGLQNCPNIMKQAMNLLAERGIQ